MQNQHIFIGKGTVYIQADGGPLLPSGNVSVAQLTWEEDDRSLADFQNPGGGSIKTLSRVIGASLALTMHDLSPANLAISTRGAVSAYAGGTVTDEAHNDIVIGGLIPFDHIPDLDVAPVVKKGVTVLTEGADYTVTSSGIIPKSGGSGNLVAGDDLLVSYTGLADNVVQMLVESAKTYRIFIEGLNEAESGRPHTLDIFKAQPGMGPLDLIGDDFAGMAVTFRLNKDTTKTGTGISQYAKLKIAAPA